MAVIEQINMPVTLIGDKMYDYHTLENSTIGIRMGSTASTVSQLSFGINPSVTNNQTSELKTRFPAGLVDSTPKLSATATVTITNIGGGDAAGIRASMKSNIGISSVPLARMISTASVELNGEKFNSSPSQFIDAQIHNMDPMNLALLSAGSEIDAYDNILSSTLYNPLRVGMDSVDSVKSRGFGCNYVVQSITPTYSATSGENKVVFTLLIEDVLPLEPFQWRGIKDAQPFHNLNEFALTINWGDLSKLISLSYNLPRQDDTENVSVSVALSNLKLVAKSWNPLPQLMPKPDEVLVYNAPIVSKILSQDVGAQPVGIPEQQTTLATATFNGVPSMFAFRVKRKRPAAVTGTTQVDKWSPDANAPIVNVSINMDNRTNILNNLTQYELAHLSARNGYNLRFASFAGLGSDPSAASQSAYGTGSWLYFRPSDLGLNADTLANVNKTMNFNLSFKINSLVSTELYTAELYAISDNFVYNKNGTFYQTRPLVTPEKALSGKIELVGSDMQFNRVLGGGDGGSFFGDLWRGVTRFFTSPFGKSAVRFARNNIPVVKDYVSDSTPIGSFARSQGYGVKKVAGKKTVKKVAGKRGGDLLKLAGGAQLSDAQMRDMLEY